MRLFPQFWEQRHSSIDLQISGVGLLQAGIGLPNRFIEADAAKDVFFPNQNRRNFPANFTIFTNRISFESEISDVQRNHLDYGLMVINQSEFSIHNVGITMSVIPPFRHFERGWNPDGIFTFNLKIYINRDDFTIDIITEKYRSIAAAEVFWLGIDFPSNSPKLEIQKFLDSSFLFIDNCPVHFTKIIDRREVS